MPDPSQDMPYLGIAVQVVGGALVVLYVVLISRTAFLKVVRGFAGMLEAVSRSSAESDVAKALHTRMQETRLTNYCDLVRLAVFWVFPGFGVSSLVQIWHNSLEEELMAVRAAAFSLAFLLHLRPQLLNLATMRTWQSVFFLIICLHVAPGVCPPHHLTVASRLSSSILTASNCMFLHVPTSVVQHGVYVAVAGVSISRSPLHGNSADWWQHVWTEAVSGLLSCGCVAMVQHVVEAQHHSKLDAEGAAERQQASTKLLSVFYEVVLEVDSELTILSCDPDLALFLPHRPGSPPPRLLGSKLDSIVPDGRDQQLLRQRMCSPPKGEEASVNVMHLDMRQGGGESINVEMFSLHFKSLTGQWRHLVGIREFSDGGGSGPVTNEPCMTLQVDMLDPLLPVRDISPELQWQLGGLVLGSSLLDVLDNPPDFTRRLQDAVNTVEYDEEELEPSARFKAVLRPLGQRACLVATCCATVDDASWGAAGGPSVRCLAHVAFSNLAPVHSNKGSRIGRAGGSSRSNISSSSGRRGTPRQLRPEPLAPLSPTATLGAPLSL